MIHRSVERRAWSWAGTLVASFCAPATFSGCSSSDNPGQPACLAQPGNLDCQAAYGLVNGEIAPTFDELWTRTLKPTCGVAGCHSGPSPQNGLALDVEDTAYAGLTGPGTDGAPRVKAGDTTCGQFMVRLETPGEPWSMPPGNHLDEPTLCVIRHWVKNGAKR